MKIVILATGGTIAGVGEPGKDTGYKSGQIAAADLIEAIPEIREIAEIEIEQICNVNSDDITDKIWLQLARRIDELCKKHEVVGIVITHGTDTMDETAFFLSLTVNTQKPIVLTGAMRPATAAEPDGPANLLGAVKTVAKLASGLILENSYGNSSNDSSNYSYINSHKASHKTTQKSFQGNASANFQSTLTETSLNAKFKSCECDFQDLQIKENYEEKELSKEQSENSTKHREPNVWIFFENELFNALQVQKCSASDLQPMHADNFPILQDIPFFNISKLQELPKVNTVYFGVDSDPRILEYAASVSDGIVIAGAGSGEFSLNFSAALKNVKIPVVISTRINHGLVTLNECLAPQGISARHLPPQKAVVLLRLALTTIRDIEKIKTIFSGF